VSDYQVNQIIAWIAIAINLVAFVVLFMKGRYAVMILSLAAALLSPRCNIRHVLASHYHGAIAMVAAYCDF
jgi:hypothetical protein